MLHDIVSILCAAGYTGEMRSKNKAKHLFSWIALDGSTKSTTTTTTTMMPEQAGEGLGRGVAELRARARTWPGSACDRL